MEVGSCCIAALALFARRPCLRGVERLLYPPSKWEFGPNPVSRDRRPDSKCAAFAVLPFRRANSRCDADSGHLVPRKPAQRRSHKGKTSPVPPPYSQRSRSLIERPLSTSSRPGPERPSAPQQRRAAKLLASCFDGAGGLSCMSRDRPGQPPGNDACLHRLDHRAPQHLAAMQYLAPHPAADKAAVYDQCVPSEEADSSLANYAAVLATSSGSPAPGASCPTDAHLLSSAWHGAVRGLL